MAQPQIDAQNPNDTTPATRAERRAAERAGQRPSRKRRAVVAGVAAALLGPGVMLGAILTDRAEIEHNVIERGTFGIEVLIGDQPITLTNAVPGSTTTFAWGIENAGTVPATVIVSMEDTSGGLELFDATDLDIRWETNGDNALTGTDVFEGDWTSKQFQIELGAGQVLNLMGTVTVPEDMELAEWETLPTVGEFSAVFDAQQADGEGVGQPGQWIG